jgi:tetratricopeptide (TPR) repeat protein
MKVLVVTRRGQTGMPIARTLREGLEVEGFKGDRSGIILREEERQAGPLSPDQMRQLGKQRGVDLVLWIALLCVENSPACVLPMITFVDPDRWEAARPYEPLRGAVSTGGGEARVLVEQLRATAAELAGILHYQQQRWALAAHHFARIPLNRQDVQHNPLTLLFQCHHHLEEWDRAEAVARTMIELGTSQKDRNLEGDGRFNLALVASSRRRFDEALREYALARELAETAGADSKVAVSWGATADVLHARGQIDEALEIRRTKQLPFYERVGDVRAIADTWAVIADMLYDRGQLDATVEILGSKVVPLYERLGDLRSIALAWGRIGDVLSARGRADQSLEIRRHKELPIYERLGDVRAAAVTWGQIADVLCLRGKLDECLKIRMNKELPLYEGLGDARSAAIAWGNVADVFADRGNIDEALKIRQTRQLPVYERLGDLQLIMIGEWKLARLLRKRGAPAEAAAHYRRARDKAREIQSPQLKELEAEIQEARVRLDAP